MSFVELAGIDDPALVTAQVSVSLGLRAGDAGAIARAIAGRELLIVLDNCEHLIGTVAALSAAILQGCDEVRILATSREPVGVPGEARYRLRPMSLPAENGADAAQSDAVRLFTDRARRADSRFRLSSETLPDVARLVRRLDGLPLAIELAAARVETLGLAQLAAGLDDLFRLLSSSGHAMAERQRSLTAAAEWSYRLLPPDEQRAFRTLACFPGGFTVEAAGAVAGQGVAAAVLHLVDCSMIVPPQQDADGRVRYTMLETMRAFGRDRLAEAGEREEAARALAGFALLVAEEAGPRLLTAADVSARPWLDAEAATLQQAMAWALEHDPDVAPRLAAALGGWWNQRGQYRTGYQTLTQILGSTEPGSEDWCAVQLWLGTLANGFLGIAASVDHFRAVVTALTDQQPGPVLVRALGSQGGALANLGRLDEAEPLARKALELARQIDDAYGESNALYWLSGIGHYRGDTAASLRWARELAAVDALRLPRKTVVRNLMGLIIPLIDAGELAEARQLCDSALGLVRSSGLDDMAAETLFHLARIELLADAPQAAGTRLLEALKSGARQAGALVLLDIFDACGLYFAQAGQRAAALTIWAAHAALLKAERVEDPVQDLRRRAEPQRRARTELGPAGARAAEDRGAAMTLPVATEFAVLTLDAGASPGIGLFRQASEVRSADGSPRTALSGREQELVVLVARGRTDAQIAAELFISVRTVRSHLDRIRDKTGCRRRADLTRLALQAGLA